MSISTLADVIGNQEEQPFISGATLANFIQKSQTDYAIPTVIGFAGSHRTGKSTLARKLAEELDYIYLSIDISSSSVWKIFSPHDTISFAERISVQERLLETMINFLYENINDNNAFYVVDRTPIDLLAYLLSNIDKTTSQLYDTQTEEFVNRCHSLARSYFAHIFVVQPAIEFEILPGKNSKVYNSIAYQATLNSVIAGQLVINKTNNPHNACPFSIIPKDVSFLEDRLSYCYRVLSDGNVR